MKDDEEYLLIPLSRVTPAELKLIKDTEYLHNGYNPLDDELAIPVRKNRELVEAILEKALEEIPKLEFKKRHRI